MKVGLITTLNTNIGDDLIRKGILHLLITTCAGHQIEIVSVNKHDPLTVYPDWHPIHATKLSRHLPRHYRIDRWIEHSMPRLRQSRFDSCDLIVQCGAPVFWNDCHRTPWAKPLWHEVVGRLHQRIPTLNLAAGSCYPWEQQPEHFSQEDEAYVRAILSYCRLTTVRDVLAQRLCSNLGAQTPVVPCTALLVAGDASQNAEEDGYILINYMEGGGHYEWDQGIDPAEWHRTTVSLIRRIQQRHKVLFLCHDEKEYHLTRGIDPSIPCFWPKTVNEYFQDMPPIKAAVCNRMHASVALAGLGIPSIAVCTDTRLLMVDALGLPCYYAKDANVDRLESDVENLADSFSQWKERLLQMKIDTQTRYLDLIQETLR